MYPNLKHFLDDLSLSSMDLFLQRVFLLVVFNAGRLLSGVESYSGGYVDFCLYKMIERLPNASCPFHHSLHPFLGSHLKIPYTTF